MSRWWVLARVISGREIYNFFLVFCLIELRGFFGGIQSLQYNGSPSSCLLLASALWS
jgi:hypothetical protein